MKPKILFLLFFLPVLAHSQFKRKELKILNSVIEKITIDLEQVLSEEWYVVPTQLGFDVHYCRTCMGKYIEWGKSEKDFHLLTKAEIWEKFGPDSIHFRSSVGIVRGPNRWETTKNNGVLKYHITFEPKWDSTQISFVQTRNDTLRDVIIALRPSKLSLGQFDDYRYHLPINYWKSKTSHLKYDFKRLPYDSKFYNYSILISPDYNCYSCNPYWLIKGDSISKSVELERLSVEVHKTEVMIAFILGIVDFVNYERTSRLKFYSMKISSDIEMR